MGFFGKKKTIVVSSTVYNMAGDEENRPHFIQNSVYGAIMSPHNPYIGETIVRNLFNGPGINQRSFFRWCLRNDYTGLPTYSVSLGKTIDPAVVAPFISTPGGQEVSIQSAHVVSGDYDHLVEEYVLENYPQNYNTDYVTSYDKTANEVTIQWEGGGSVTFSGGTYSPEKVYIVANYLHYIDADVGDLITGTTTIADTSQPDAGNYDLDDSYNTGDVDYNMDYDERVITTYTGVPTLPSDTDVTTPDLSDTFTSDTLVQAHSKTTYEGGDGFTEETISREHFLHITFYWEVYTNNTQVSLVVNTDTPAAGQTETIETRRIGDHVRSVYDWRIDTQDTIIRSIVDGKSRIFIYEVGTGEPTLDALYEGLIVGGDETEYFPYMPIRLDNTSIRDPIYDDITGSGLYEFTNRAYRRAASRVHKFSSLVDEIEENEDIDDIDYAFTQHGVAMNVLEPECRKYLYKWFRNVSEYQETSSNYMTGYAASVAVYVAELAAMSAWVYAQGDPLRSGYGDARPTDPKLVSLETTTIRLACEDAQLQNLDMRVTWVNITETLHSGTPTNPETGEPAVVDEIWLEDGTDLEWAVTTGLYPNVYSKDFKVEQIIMYWQTGVGAYKKMTMWGLLHQNYVYGGESVDISGKEGLQFGIPRVDQEPTGFIVPLHMPTVRDLGLVSATQMATANTFIIFNTYEIVKQKWYQTIVGMIIIFIIIVAITVITGGLGAGSVGILGTNAAVGAAVGLTGTAAILAGAIINALVAIAISQIVSYASTAIFGDKWGAIIATVINLMISMGTSGISLDNLSELGTASNILKIASAVANGYEGYTQGAVAEIGDDMIEDREEFETEMEKIDKMLSELIGGNGLNFDPLSLTDSVKGNGRLALGGGYITETLDEFIHRTTMTGSDVVEITLSMVNNFADLSLELPS